MSINKKDFLKNEWQKTNQDLKGYHIHIYFDAEISCGFMPTSDAYDEAQELAENLKKLFPEHVQSTHQVMIVGPHPKPNIEIDINKEGFGEIMAWLQMNNPSNLSILIHPETSDVVKDHLESAIWLGEPVPFKKGFFNPTKQKINTHLNKKPNL